MYTRKEIEDRVNRLVQDHLDADPEKMTDDATIESLGGDSLDSVEIVMALEEEFDIEIPDDALDGIQTIKGMVDYVEKKL